jgi:deoxyadenosine/deoxycytidine kinase
MNADIQIISLEGNIGSGKTTLLTNLKKQYENNPNVIFLKEPVDEWSEMKDEHGITMLEKFYSDQPKYSFSFQMMAYISRLKILKDVIKNINTIKLKDNKDNKKENQNQPFILITERSLYTDKMVFAKMLFDSGKIEYINYQIYLNWFNTFADDFPVNKIIYVKADPEICYARISKRNRAGENNIPIEYLTSCDNYHNNMLDKSLDDCVCEKQLILDGNINIYDNADILADWINRIDDFIQNKNKINGLVDYNHNRL